MATNFDLAPPVTMVDGLVAVPIDIQSITGVLRFDGATQQSVGDVTINFTMGEQDGCPVFDLRQTITEAWLDDASINPSQLGHHDFGGGPDAELRILNITLTAGSLHSLRLCYQLAIPQASTAGSYQPGLNWSAGPRLTFNFGFTDLGPGRYLESWIPANLIFDQYDIDVNFIVENTSIAHEMITNGSVTLNSINNWRVQWPGGSTALSTLLEIRSADSVTHLDDSVILPASGTSVAIEAWKLSSSATDLVTQINLIKTFLVENENNVGSYVHANRFVAFFITGGMEYDGATTTGTGPLRHETFHSWWGRGIKPASQNDGWWDEAWTVYNMSGGSSSIPFDFSRPPIELSSMNPWRRLTHGDSYTEGKRVFEGLAALTSADSLKLAMRDFYTAYKHKPATTTQLESHLLCKLGKKDIVDGFHRFVYGFGNPVATPDLWLKDDPGHTGSDSWGGVYWNSPDLWIRNRDDEGEAHQNPEYGQDNWFYARVRNRSMTATAQHFAVSFRAVNYAGMQFVFPNDFLPCTAASAEFLLGPGEERIVKARWPRSLVPPPGSHSCLLASVLTRHDQPAEGNRVWEKNNLAQKNLTVVDLRPNDWFVLPVVIRNLFRRRFPWFELRLSRLPGADAADVELIHPKLNEFLGFTWLKPVFDKKAEKNIKQPLSTGLLDCGADHDHASQFNNLPWTSINPASAIAPLFEKSESFQFRKQKHSKIYLSLPYDESYTFGLKIKLPAHVKAGSVLRFHLAQRLWPWRCLQGGVSVEVRVKD